MLTDLVIGGTGLVGSHFVEFASSSAKVVCVGRRAPKSEGSNVSGLVEKDLSKWPDIIKETKLPAGSTFFSAFGTTRAAAGGNANFKVIDGGTNIDCFKAARENKSIDTAIIVSSMGASADSKFPYMQVKGQIEDEIKALKFKRTIILRPGMLLGEREHSKGWANTLGAKVGSMLYGTWAGSLVGTPIKGADVAKVANYLNGQDIKEEGEVITVSSAEMLDLAKTIN